MNVINFKVDEIFCSKTVFATLFHQRCPYWSDFGVVYKWGHTFFGNFLTVTHINAYVMKRMLHCCQKILDSPPTPTPISLKMLRHLWTTLCFETKKRPSLKSQKIPWTIRLSENHLQYSDIRNSFILEQQISDKNQSHLDSEKHHCVLTHQLQDVRQGQVCDVDILLLGLEHEHQALHCRNEVLVGQDYTLGGTRGSWCVHDDGGVLWRWVGQRDVRFWPSLQNKMRAKWKLFEKLIEIERR